MSEDNLIYVGDKPFMNYVTAVVMQFTSKNQKQVIVKSRGKFISKAVDVTQVVMNRFLKDIIIIGNIHIGSETFTNKDGREVRVSIMDITLKAIKEPPKNI